MELLSKIKTVYWFLVRPEFWPQLMQLLKRNLNTNLENSRIESSEWCQNLVTTKIEALKILGYDSKFESLEDIYPKLISKAKKKEISIPVKMGGEGAISFLYHLIRSNNLKVLVESGVAYGWSSLAMLLALSENEGGHLYSNDMPYIKMNNEDFVGSIVPKELHQKWELQRLADITGIPKIFDKISGTIDLFHYDSDKSYTGRMWASDVIWEKLRIGGFFVSDDINDNLAFRHFTEKVNREPIVIKHLDKYVGIIRK